MAEDIVMAGQQCFQQWFDRGLFRVDLPRRECYHFAPPRIPAALVEQQQKRHRLISFLRLYLGLFPAFGAGRRREVTAREVFLEGQVQEAQAILALPRQQPASGHAVKQRAVRFGLYQVACQ